MTRAPAQASVCAGKPWDGLTLAPLLLRLAGALDAMSGEPRTSVGLVRTLFVLPAPARVSARTCVRHNVPFLGALAGVAAAFFFSPPPPRGKASDRVAEQWRTGQRFGRREGHAQSLEPEPGGSRSTTALASMPGPQQHRQSRVGRSGRSAKFDRAKLSRALTGGMIARLQALDGAQGGSTACGRRT